MKKDNNRLAFEKWCRATRPVLSTLSNEHGHYQYSETAAAWRAWRHFSRGAEEETGLLEHCKACSKEVAKWPEWKRNGANVLKFQEVNNEPV